jgi:hypothetical protein
VDSITNTNYGDRVEWLRSKMVWILRHLESLENTGKKRKREYKRPEKYQRFDNHFNV